MNKAMIDEKALLQSAREHQREALIAIYDAYQAHIYAYANRTLLDVDLAEDCTAETFHRFLEALEKGKGPAEHLRAYLYRIAHNWMMDHFRNAKRMVPQAEPINVDDADDKPLPNELVIQHQTSAELQEQLRQLTAEQREVIILRFVEDYSLNETAQIVNKPTGAVKSLQNRALNNLRKYYLQKGQKAI